jgi:RND family efflux transporter MFP subunit
MPTFPSPAKPASLAAARFRIALLVSLSLLAGCKPRNAFQPPPPPEVTVERPLQRDVTEYLEESGQLAATNSVDLMARVQGYLDSIGYRDGAFVEKGTPLFTIEPAPYRAQLDQARATLASAMAKAEFSELQYKRYSDLAKTDSTSRQQAEQTLSDRDSDHAAVMQAQASLTQAQISYGYTQVAAPFDGIVTAHQANIGELVGGSQATQLATIVQLDPIWVNFNIAEQDVLRIKSSATAHGPTSFDLHTVAVEIGLQDEAGYPHRGHIDYVSPQVDSGTGTLAARGLFDNPAHVLLPGYFARIRIPVGSLKGALMVPDDAVGSDQGGRTLLVVTPTNVVEARAVTLGTRDGNLQIIKSGLKSDDRVIVDGLQRVRIGQKVVPHEIMPTDAPHHDEEKP